MDYITSNSLVKNR